MDAHIAGVRVAGTPEGPVPVVLLAPDDPDWSADESVDAAPGDVETPLASPDAGDGETGDEATEVGDDGATTGEATDEGGDGATTGEATAEGADADGTAAGSTDEVLPIFIGFDEAISIARGLDAVDIGRPLTHDLLLDVVEELGSRVARVEVSDLSEEGTYIADVFLQTPREEVAIDARPSDSLALAARTNAPIQVARSVFEAGRRGREDFEDLADVREVAGL